jgi:hypothetical protein
MNKAITMIMTMKATIAIHGIEKKKYTSVAVTNQISTLPIVFFMA